MPTVAFGAMQSGDLDLESCTWGNGVWEGFVNLILYHAGLVVWYLANTPTDVAYTFKRIAE